MGVLLGGEDYEVYRREDLLALAREAADGARVEALEPEVSAAFNFVILHRDLQRDPPARSGA